ncbi:hypothetical protein ABC195_16545 [Microbacterium sp. 2P01SA-2]|uniref:hypothetical protein n=1 Tax=Microbacterium TaxID=33882 RepID=UPI001AE1A164|nr:MULTISPECIES: hypothetical protein [Microbacterium]MBP2422215.1 hypothetical protein [Microbacterium imperiale]MDD7930775.1 hypothetical protein [Microbacterium thalli]MDS0200688.1 hypothetical protein [Microbacterium imperiale]WHE37833.1 hypothetical protein P6897_16010 [Microbacterium sp. BDGP8]
MSWHNGAVPSRHEFSSEMPERVRNVLDALGSNNRVEALLFFSAHRTASRQQLAAGTSIPFGSTSVITNDLQRFGYLVASDEGGRRGAPIMYTIDRKRLHDDVAALMAHFANLGD